MLVTFRKKHLNDIGTHEFSDELEKGYIVFFPRCPLDLPSESALAYLRSALAENLKSKEASYHPENNRVSGIRGDPKLARRTRELLIEHSHRVQAMLRQVIPALVPGWTVGTTAFRPVEEKDRKLEPDSSNELLHIDAADGATNGDRILRFFVNVNPTEDRVWATLGTFRELYERFGADAGIAGDSGGRPAGYLKKGVTDHLLGATTRTLESMGVAQARTLNSSPYDRVMRRFHNYMKDTPGVQQDSTGYREFRFPPYSAWMALTDTCSHACISGQHALVNTFQIRLSRCRLPEHAPINILKYG